MVTDDKTIELYLVPQPAERRRPEAVQLRVWFDQIKTVEAMTQDQWVDNQIYRDQSGCPPYLAKCMWLAYLREEALRAANRLYECIIQDAA